MTRSELDTGDRRYFVTWGRIQDKVDPAPLEQLVFQHSSRCDLGGEPVRAILCDSLREARDERYFFEALLAFGQQQIPYGDSYAAWRAETQEAMENGRELYYLGRWRT